MKMLCLLLLDSEIVIVNFAILFQEIRIYLHLISVIAALRDLVPVIVQDIINM